MKRFILAAVSVLALAVFAGGAYADCGKECCKKSKPGTSGCDSKSSGCNMKTTDASKDPARQSVVVDPACGMDVEVKDAKYSYEYNGKKYYFCSKSCRKRFVKEPEKYIGKEPK